MIEPKVLVSFPSGGACEPAALMAAIHAAQRVRSTLTWDAGIAPAAAMRNRIVRGFLDSDHTHLFFIDDDTVLLDPANALPKLLSLDADIAVGVVPFYQRQHGGMILNVQRSDAEGWIKPWPVGSFPIRRAGTACMLIRRSVFERMPWPWFSYYQDQDNSSITSEDLPFCDHARSLGMTLWCDASVRCDHIKKMSLALFCPPIPGGDEHE